MKRTAFFSAFSLLLICWLAVIDSSIADPGKLSSARALDWRELVPDNWEPPIIAKAHDKAAEEAVTADALVQDLEGLQVCLPGFMKPTVFTGSTVSEFILVPYLPHHVKQHAHLEANQMVYVTLDIPVVVTTPFDPIWVTGTMRLQTVATDEGPTGYSLAAAETRPYEP
jgi:hypothetical protein